MKFKGRALMKSDPEFELETLLEPMTLHASFSGGFSGTIGEVRAEVGRIPINIAIPFHPGRRMVTVASIGGFRVNIRPMSLHIKECRIEATGVLGGEKGLRASMRGKVNCETEMKGAGDITGTAGSLTLQLGDEGDRVRSRRTDKKRDAGRADLNRDADDASQNV